MSEELEQRLMGHWFAAQSPEIIPDDSIHPDDDMYRDDVLQMDAARRSFEYMRSGYEAFRVLLNVLEQADRKPKSILDFGCGYGRLMRFLVQRWDPQDVWASDVLKPAVDFVRSSFGVPGFYSTNDPDTLDLERKYSLIWVGSLFTHLPGYRFRGFLPKLFSALEPDGLLVFSTHTQEVLGDVDRHPTGFTYQRHSESRLLDLDEYGATFVTPRSVRSMCKTMGIENVWILERELWRIQDLYVMSPGPVPGLASWSNAPILRGSISKSTVEDDHAWVGGWVRSPIHMSPIADVRVCIDGEHWFEAQHREKAEPLAASEGGESFRQTDWYIEGSTQKIGPGEHTLVAVARTQDGRQDAFDASILQIPATT